MEGNTCNGQHGLGLEDEIICIWKDDAYIETKPADVKRCRGLWWKLFFSFLLGRIIMPTVYSSVPLGNREGKW
jgi:hypothetical protein